MVPGLGGMSYSLSPSVTDVTSALSNAISEAIFLFPSLPYAYLYFCISATSLALTLSSMEDPACEQQLTWSPHP